LIYSDFKDFIGKLPPSGKIMAVDWGAARTGIAISDAAREWTFPRPQVSPDAAQIARTAAEDNVVGILVGLPPAGKTADEIRAFAASLAARTDTPILLYDEHLSSKAAEDLLHEAGLNTKQQKGKSDSVAALVVLDEFLKRMKDAA
jgi:putative Holliday junction resolvase